MSLFCCLHFQIVHLLACLYKCYRLEVFIFVVCLLFNQNSNLLSRYLEVGRPWINDFKMPHFLILSTEHPGALVLICNTHVCKDLCTHPYRCLYVLFVCLQFCCRVQSGLGKKHLNKTTEIFYI